MAHYHIHWSDSKVDWQKFHTPEDAETEAVRLVKAGETYTIVKYEDDCPQCAESVTPLETQSGTKRQP